MEKIFSLIILLSCLSFSQAWFENCNYNYSVQTNTKLILTSPNYPNRYNSGSSCKIYLTAPTRYTIELNCTYNLDVPLPDCQSQRLYVSRDGDRNLAYADYYCDYSAFVRSSVGIEMSLGYTSNLGAAGWFYCEAKAVQTTQDNCQCGWSRSTRIIGGSLAQPNEYVSMAGLYDKTMVKAPEGPVFCGSAIITENYAMTAAHCFNINRTIANIALFVGDNNSSIPNPTLYQVTRIIRHQLYNKDSSDQNNDIALVETWEAIKWKKTIGPACLPYIYNGYETYFDGYPLVVLGWGAIEYAGPSSVMLKKTSLAVINSQTCNNTYHDINPRKICTFANGTDSCQRDSGGNLYWYYNGRQYTVGIVSYGRDCAGKYPAVNTRVTAYLDWIGQQLPNSFFCGRF